MKSLRYSPGLPLRAVRDQWHREHAGVKLSSGNRSAGAEQVFLSPTVASTNCFSRSYKKAPNRQLQKIVPTGRAFPKLTKGPWCEASVWILSSTLPAVRRSIEIERSLLFYQLPLWLPCTWIGLTQDLRIWCKTSTSENP